MAPTVKADPTGPGPVPPDAVGGRRPRRLAPPRTAGSCDERATGRRSSRLCSISTTTGTSDPAAEEIAARSGLSPRSLFRYFDDVDDLIRAAIRSQEARALPLLPVGAEPDDPLDVKVAALVDQRFQLFDAIGHAAAVAAAAVPLPAAARRRTGRNRRYLRSQVRRLFAPELGGMDDDRVASALAAADVLTSFEAYQLLVQHRAMAATVAKGVMVDALMVLLGPS